MKHHLVNLPFFVTIFFILSSCNKDELVINNVNDFDAYLVDEMDWQSIPALSSVIFKDDQVLHESYLGKSNLEQGIRLENNHLFLLASVSKVTTAIALLQLYDDGLFNMDDNVNDYLPYEVNHPDHNTAITFRMLLTHTASIADNWAILDQQYYYGQDSPVALDFFIENYFTPNGDFYDYSDNFYDFEPGTDYEYSNIGNALIGVLVEQISGQDFNTYCKQNIFTPLGMSNTFWRLDEVNQTITLPYDYTNGSYEAIGHYCNTDYPNGGLRSTGLDLHKLLVALANGGTTNNFELLKSSTVNNMFSPQITYINNDTGWHLFQLDANNNLWGHDGAEQGVATIMAFNPITKVGAIILTNQGEADLDEMLVEAYKLGLTL